MRELTCAIPREVRPSLQESPQTFGSGGFFVPPPGLTLLGGGAFGNPEAWILDAMARAIDLYRDAGLQIVVVSYGRPNPALRRFF